MTKKLTSAKRKKLTKQLAWDYFSLYIRVRDNFTCVLCGNSYEQGYIMQAGHVIGRSIKAIKWAEDNVFCQCFICNGQHRYHPEVYFNWFINKYGLEKFQEYSSAEVKHRITKDRDAEILDEYRAKLLGANSGHPYTVEALAKLEKQHEKLLTE